MSDHRTKDQRAWLNELRWRIDHDAAFWQKVKHCAGIDRHEITHYSFRRYKGEFYFVQITHEGRGYLILRVLSVCFVDGLPMPFWPDPVVAVSAE